MVFGGWHPTLCPESTLREPYVDVVVRGQGEITIVELANALASKQPLGSHRGYLLEEAGAADTKLRTARSTRRHLRSARVRSDRLRRV